MQYLGSKNRISKYIVPIIQSYIDRNNCTNYIEPFVGGANVIDKIKCENKEGSDIHPYLIALLKQAQTDATIFPETVTEEEYKRVKNNKEFYSEWYVGLVGFCATFSCKWFSGYARGFKEDKITPRDIPSESIRNIVKQAENLKDIKFSCCDFRSIDKRLKGAVIYCDIPYRNTTKYKNAIFPYEIFYKWCKEMAVNNTVLISEYNMPSEFKCIWEKEVKINIDSKRKLRNAEKISIEKLFIA